MKELIKFLDELKHNNNREWFGENRSRYKQVNEQFNQFTQQLIDGISEFDPAIIGNTVKDCTYRIYRDTRFSNNKLPYKTHMGAYICEGGKKSGLAGYYFHVEAHDEGFVGGNAIIAGLHCPMPKVARSVRDEIFDNGEQFLKSIGKAKGFEVDMREHLKRMPKEYSEGAVAAKYLTLKEFCLNKYVDDKFICSDDLLERTLEAFASTKDYVAQLNRATKYAFEEM